MQWTASVFLVVLLFFALPTYPQLRAPLGRCGPSPRDPNWPPNQLPSEQVLLEAQKRPAVDVLGLRRDAQELAELSASIAVRPRLLSARAVCGGTADGSLLPEPGAPAGMIE